MHHFVLASPVAEPRFDFNGVRLRNLSFVNIINLDYSSMIQIS